jgi:predicted nucleic acid-binding protein
VIVVADTSVIINLCRIGQARLLLSLFQRVVVPQAVADEFIRLTRTRDRFENLEFPEWIEQQLVDHESTSVVEADLDIGETAAIALSLKIGADALLIDESLGRSEALRLGLRTIGILGILIEAKNRTLIQDLKPLLTRLENEAGFWIAPDLRSQVLFLVGE